MSNDACTVICTVDMATGRVTSIPGQQWPPPEEAPSMRCKFKLDRAEIFMVDAPTGARNGGQDVLEPRVMHTLVLHPVRPKEGDPDHENSRFWRATPLGELRLQTIDAEAAAGLQLGGEYFLELRPADVCAA